MYADNFLGKIYAEPNNTAQVLQFDIQKWMVLGLVWLLDFSMNLYEE